MSETEIHALQIQLARLTGILESELGSEPATGHIHLHLEDIRREIRELKNHIVGTPDSPGMTTRLDRLEVAQRHRLRLNTAALVALISLWVKAAWEMIVR